MKHDQRKDTDNRGSSENGRRENRHDSLLSLQRNGLSRTRFLRGIYASLESFDRSGMAQNSQSTRKARRIMSDDLNVNIGFTPKPPKPPKRHPIIDIMAIFFASALIGTVAQSSVVFAVVCAACIIAYVMQYAKGSEMRNKSKGENTP